MKELSIEQKAERYDEALKQIKECTPDENGFIIIYPQEIFPELKWSEDEKIRKDIIHLVQKSHEQGGYALHKYEADEMLAWLEKQSEKHLENYDEAEKEKADFVGDGFIECHADFLDFKEGNTYWLEYMGDDKYNVRSDNLLGKTYHITPCQLYTVFKKLTWLEKQGGDQKHIDKPKFKVGDWVVWQDKCYKVNYNGCGYELVDQNGLNTSLEYGTIDENAHLWDITKDANNGDVLDANGAPFIYKKHDKDYVHFYCGVNLAGEFIEANGIDTWNNNHKVYPATKEQRNTLMKAMAEAGYTFDFGKKELKEIERKSVITIPKFKVGDKVYELRNRFECTIESIDETTYYGDTTNFDIKDQDDWELVEQKSDWSKEDEDAIGIAIIALDDMYDPDEPINTYAGYSMPFNKAAERLKPLKDRYTWKPSDEQINAVRLARSFVVDDFDEHPALSEILIELEEQLKKLK